MSVARVREESASGTDYLRLKVNSGHALHLRAEFTAIAPDQAYGLAGERELWHTQESDPGCARGRTRVPRPPVKECEPSLCREEHQPMTGM
jgi:hypothetical protein